MQLQAAQSTYRIAMGSRAQRKVPSLQSAPRRRAPITQQLNQAHGFDLHVGSLGNIWWLRYVQWAGYSRRHRGLVNIHAIDESSIAG
jgi:hypothetical protein